MGRSGEDTHTFRSQSGCEDVLLIRYDGDGSQTQGVRLWKEGRRTNDVIWVVVVVLVVTREPERRGRNPSDSILFCEL